MKPKNDGLEEIHSKGSYRKAVRFRDIYLQRVYEQYLGFIKVGAFGFSVGVGLGFALGLIIGERDE